jgi:cyanophycin synthetase
MHNVQNAMFAAALAFSLDIKLDAIRQALRTFDSTFFQAPGRMNVYDEHPFKVIFDYAHNAHAVRAMTDLAARLDVRGRRIVVVAGPGDRRDEDIRAIADQVAGRFDHYICRRDDGLRGRASDEVPNMIAQVLRESGVPLTAIDVIPDEQEAIAAGLAMGRPGDLLMVFADALTRSWKQVIKFKPAASSLSSAASSDSGAASSKAAPADANILASAAANGASAADAVAGAGGGAAAATARATANAGTANSIAVPAGAAAPGREDAALDMSGYVRDDRGLRFAGEASD